MASLRYLAACIGLPQNFSVVGHFFGYASLPPWNQAQPSQNSLPQSLSLLTQMKRLKQTHFHLNIIRVGTGGDGLMDDFNEQNVDCAVQITRNIYAAAGVGIGRVERWWMIPLADNHSYEIINDDCEAEELVDEYSVPNNGADCFVVPTYAGSTLGLHPDDGVVVELREGNFLGTGRTMAHELGHLFGLGHENDNPWNLMCQTKYAQKSPSGQVHPAAVQLDADQVEEIKDDDAMHGPC